MVGSFFESAFFAMVGIGMEHFTASKYLMSLFLIYPNQISFQALSYVVIHSIIHQKHQATDGMIYLHVILVQSWLNPGTCAKFVMFIPNLSNLIVCHCRIHSFTSI